MPSPFHPALLLALAAPAAVASESDVRLAQLTIRERIIIRVPRMEAASDRTPLSATPPARWKEAKGPKCIPAQGMAGAMIAAPKQVDLVQFGGRRIRAKLNGDCKPLDFYGGFYLRPAADGMICAGRDAIRMRSGGSCGIDTFKVLVAQR